MCGGVHDRPVRRLLAWLLTLLAWEAGGATVSWCPQPPGRVPARVAAQREAEIHGSAAAHKAAFDEAEPSSSTCVSTRRVRAAPLPDANLSVSSGIQPVLRGAIPGPGSPGGWSDRRPAPLLELDLRKAARQEGVVGLHVAVPVSAEVERNDLRLAGLPRTIASSITARMAWFGSGAGTIPCTRRSAIAISRLPNGRD